MNTGFKQFLLRGNVIDLAVAVVVGGAFGSVVSALVKDFLTPLIAAIGGQPDFSALTFTLNGSRFAYGDFLNSVLSFLIISAVVYYLVVLPVNLLVARSAKSSTPAAEVRRCPECYSEIPQQARRCPCCTSELTPVPKIRTAT
jgi:large conductance mechanosensitive channel